MRRILNLGVASIFFMTISLLSQAQVDTNDVKEGFVAGEHKILFLPRWKEGTRHVTELSGYAANKDENIIDLEFNPEDKFGVQWVGWREDDGNRPCAFFVMPRWFENGDWPNSDKGMMSTLPPRMPGDTPSSVVFQPPEYVFPRSALRENRCRNDDVEDDIDILGYDDKKRFFIRNLRVCNSKVDKHHKRLKGVEVQPAKIFRETKVRGPIAEKNIDEPVINHLNTTKKFEHNNCAEDGWKKYAECNPGEAAIGVQVHFSGPDDSVIGLALICQEVEWYSRVTDALEDALADQ